MDSLIGLSFRAEAFKSNGSSSLYIGVEKMELNLDFVAVEVVVTDDVGLASTGPLPTPLPLLELSLDVDEAGAEAAIIEADCSTDGGNLKSIRLRG